MHVDARDEHRLDFPRASLRSASDKLGIFVPHNVGKSVAQASSFTLVMIVRNILFVVANAHH